MHYKIPLMLLLVSGWASANPNRLDSVSKFQNDGWSCGIHSSHRVLNHFELNDSYSELKSFIGQHEFKYNLTKTITEEVRVEVCERLPWPLDKACNWTTKTVERATTVKVPLKLGIGRGLYQLKDKLNDWGVRAVARERLSMSELEGLIDDGKHVLTLMQLEKVGWELISYPSLHWIVAVGYDNQSIRYYDTDSNSLFSKDRGLFFDQWDWNYDGWNKRSSPVHAHLTRAEGLEIRSVIYFDAPYIDKIAILFELEDRVDTEVPARIDVVDRSLNNRASRRVAIERDSIIDQHKEAGRDLDGLYNDLNKLISEG